MKRFPSLACAAVAALVAVPIAVEAQISPETGSATIAVGETVVFDKTVTLGAGGADLVDLFFLADNTGSMGGIINSAKAGASSILAALPTTYRFGVGRYYEDSSESSFARGYDPQVALGGSNAAVQGAINAWGASGGGDFPEANFEALKRMADEEAWGASAKKIVVWFGDAPSHTETTTEAEAIAALNAAGVEVIAFNSTSAGFGIDDGEDFSDPSGQASRVAAATDGRLVNNFASADFVDVVLDEIATSTSTVDLVFGHTFAGTGLSILIECNDALGCTGVDAGESRDFRVSIMGMTPGTYEFDVFAEGVSGTERDIITVTGDPPVGVPEPGSLLLMATGLVGISMRRRRS